MSVAIGTPQPADPGRPSVEPRVDRGRHDHAAQGGRDRQRGPLAPGQLAGQQLALDLEPDDEEEDRHQPVVDPVGQRQLQADGAGPQAGRQVQQALVGPGPGRVRPREGGHRRRDQDDAARRLVGEEVARPGAAGRRAGGGGRRACARALSWVPLAGSRPRRDMGGAGGDPTPDRGLAAPWRAPGRSTPSAAPPTRGSQTRRGSPSGRSRRSPPRPATSGRRGTRRRRRNPPRWRPRSRGRSEAPAVSPASRRRRG